MTEYYVFDNENTAIEASNYIDIVAGFPWIGVFRGRLATSNVKTERWGVPMQRLDGKWVLQRIPESYRSQQPKESIDYFNSNFPHSVEEYIPNWFSVDDSL